MRSTQFNARDRDVNDKHQQSELVLTKLGVAKKPGEADSNIKSVYKIPGTVLGTVDMHK